MSDENKVDDTAVEGGKDSPKKATPKKKAPPKKSAEEKNADDDAADGDGEASARKPRNRKEVQRLEYEVPVAKVGVEVMEGKGTSLGDIDNVAFNLGRAKSEDLINLHKLLFSKPGVQKDRKKNIRLFSGFVWDSPEDKEKLVAKVSKLVAKDLKYCLELLDLERSGKKEDMVARLVDFLEKPKSSGKRDKAAAHEKKMAKKRKRSEKSKKGKGKSKSKKSKKGEGKSKKGAGDDADADDAGDDSGDGEAEESEEPPKKKAKPAKKPAKEAAEESSSDDAPIQKKSSKPEASDANVEKFFEDMGKKNEIWGKTRKQLTKVAEDHFGCDLSEKKSVIKAVLARLVDEGEE